MKGICAGFCGAVLIRRTADAGSASPANRLLLDIAESPLRTSILQSRRHALVIDGDMLSKSVTTNALDSLLTQPSQVNQIVRNLQRRGEFAALVFDRQSGSATIFSGHLGGYPIYYWQTPDGLFFSSNPSSLSWDATRGPDMTGISEYLRWGYTTGKRWLIDGVRILFPEECLTVSPDGIVRTALRNDPWFRTAHASNIVDAESRVWEALSDAARAADAADSQSNRSALMMSGGWDSRTVLAIAAKNMNREILCYSHGDAMSRELTIAQALAEKAQQAFTTGSISTEQYSVDHLEECVRRSGTSSFPHWATAGQRLQKLGATSVTCGVYGELLGGRLSLDMLTGSRIRTTEKISAFFDRLPKSLETAAGLLDLVRIGTYELPWFVLPYSSAEAASITDGMNDDAERIANMMIESGSIGLDAIEAFHTCHRRGRYTNAQVRSIRPGCTTFNPLSSIDAVIAVRSIPVRARFNNSLNQRLLRTHFSEMLELPVAASLLPARWPTPLQQASRIARIVIERAHWQMHSKLPGLGITEPHLSWVNFQFLHGSGTFEAILESLRLPIWNRRAIRNHLDSINHASATKSLHPMLDVMLRMFDVDRLTATNSGVELRTIDQLVASES